MKIILTGLIAGLAMLAAPALAQKTETTCGWVLGKWKCESQGRLSQGEIMQSGAAVVGSYADKEIKRAQLESLKLQNQKMRADMEASRKDAVTPVWTQLEPYEAVNLCRSFAQSEDVGKAIVKHAKDSNMSDAEFKSLSRDCIIVMLAD